MPKNDATFTTWQGFLAVLSLLSRLPLPHLPAEAFRAAPRLVWAYPMVGALLGSLVALSGWIASAWLGLPAVASAGIMLGVSLLLTGAMHEDGLADTCDGFWGGLEPARRLAIMKDSQIGSYGVLALLVVTGLRWSALALLVQTSLWPVIAIGAVSRGILPLAMATTRPARSTGLAHSVGRPGIGAALLALGIALLVAVIFAGWAAVPLFLLSLAVVWTLRRIALRKIGGQTGDVLGAMQQLGEVTMLLYLIAG